MKNLVINFWNGKVTLWKSYWLVGELLNSLVVLIIFNLEIRLFKNALVTNFLPFLSLENFSFQSKIFLILWTAFITIGIWRSAEEYKGNFTWVLMTLIFLSYRIFTLRIVFI